MPVALAPRHLGPHADPLAEPAPPDPRPWTRRDTWLIVNVAGLVLLGVLAASVG
jgi:hypothetical protein